MVMRYDVLVENRIEELSEIAKDFWDWQGETPKFTYDLRGKVGGRAFINQNRIAINKQAIEKYTDEYIKQTIGHEFAHIVQYNTFSYNIKPHGQEWAAIMRSFGLPAKRCHSYELKSARKEYQYSCSKCGVIYNFGCKRHYRAQHGAVYTHVGCGGWFRYDNIIKK